MNCLLCGKELSTEGTVPNASTPMRAAYCPLIEIKENVYRSHCQYWDGIYELLDWPYYFVWNSKVQMCSVHVFSDHTESQSSTNFLMFQHHCSQERLMDLIHKLQKLKAFI